MSSRYGDRGFGRYGDPEEERAEDRDFDERDATRPYGESARGYGEAGERYGREYGAARRGGQSPARGGDYGREREYGSRDYSARDYGSRRGAGDYGPREYGGGETGERYGRERLAGGGAYGIPDPRRREGEDYGRGYAPRAYGREAGRDYERGERGERGRPRVAREDEGVRDYDTDYGRTTSRFYGRSGYEYGREDYDRDDDDRDERRAYAGRAYAGRDDERGGGSWLDRAADQVRSWFGNDDDDREHGGRREEFRGRGDGKFRGRGPKNYQRSDDRLREEVCDRLSDNEWLDASEVEVNVAAGEVVLTGTVDSRYAKRLAENIAESVTGVANVQNNLRVHSYQAATETPAPALPAADVTAAAATTGATDVSSSPSPDSGPGEMHTPPAGHSSRAAGGS
ncbi:MAG TPA: BON domain-containing protein [Pyrinomonadaceae bacterium]